jgi:putative nucleotidyltransferase with HDIG domain
MSTHMSPTIRVGDPSRLGPFLLHEALVHLNSITHEPLPQPLDQGATRHLLPPYEVRQQDSLKDLVCYTLSALISLLKAKDLELYQHSLRVQHFSGCLMQTLTLTDKETVTIELAALFHDIGKISIPDKVLHKPSRLTSREYENVKAHCARGAHMLHRVKMLDEVAHLVYHHHERWDGSGYPSGLAGEAIPLGARIVAIADAFEVMTSERTYQTKRTTAQALEELQRCAGTQFDATLVKCFCTSLKPDFFN